MPAPVVSNASVQACGVVCVCGKSHTSAVPNGSLAANEGAKSGHTLTKHVLKEPPAKKAQLDKRLEDEPNLKAASTYDSEIQAEHAVNDTLEANSEEVKSWLASDAKTNLPLKGPLDGGQVRVKGTKGQVFSRKGNTAIVVLKKDATKPDGYIVLTSYPTLG